MKNVNFELSNVHLHGSSLRLTFSLREKAFVDTLHWQT
jgi:hypothetical protein